ncbi:beta-ketoacyl-[acyl-carrier-protein] synthase II [Cephaloticoccus primus]|uniref:3-oxoacyl-[acyl-carrier-protein] synthase 2 n=1 Tax=Cephaloticoccus primus TaxID=1548207 RepID=A0A139SR39_9BACT|nr:beta-ketoacyl-ACP synthase II [Cephaloticoccus primus]KXU36974.1 beta-ketoacyl-[acyl-carrier-protein] synthase II [Cephaloticoccus primus]
MLTQSAEQRRVVVTGLGAVTAVGHDVASFWQALVAGESGIRRVQRFDPSPFASQMGAEVLDWEADQHMDPKEARRSDRYTHFGYVAASQAVADSGLDLEAEDGDRIGVMIGSGIGGMYTYESQLAVLAERGPRKVSPFTIPSLIGNMCSGMVAIKYGVRGPNFGLVSACATGAHAIGEAMHTIQRGDADVMIAGGSEAAITPFAYATFCAMKAMSERNDEPARASRPFDRQRDGFVMGEGAGILILESLEHARARGARIYCELAGYAASCDAFHITQPDPEGRGLLLAMSRAIGKAGLAPGDIDYINAHGTSTPYNDKFETLAIKKLFGEHASRLAVSSTKSMTGHLLGAAGGIESVIAIKTIETGTIAPTINLDEPDLPDCDLDYVPHTARAKPVRAVLSNNLGFGGQNASLVFKAM